ncbi:glycosyltransferase family 39 protein [Sphingomonas sp. PB2P12]|uniref:glycosyltransferase family 39 protein n=1 Tax=Sphingomonas sandaracina TaxID=3096157 RepID=UPI002FC843D3
MLGLAVLLIILALLRPVDHDESQYVAAAALTARGLIPYRDFAYLQTPLQPYLFAPIALLAGAWTWPALRIANALLGLATITAVHRAARIGRAGPRAAAIAAALFATCDILLFSIGTARNDALPAACLALALPAIVRTARDQASRRDAILIGALLAAAATAKISYALPALTYGIWALFRADRRPWWTLLGTLPFVAFVGALFVHAPDGFLFGVLAFPGQAPTEWYQARPWKLSNAAKIIDTLKFLALGPALLAIVATTGRRHRWHLILDLLILAGLIAALAPVPTWRQYLLPMLPALFVRLALVWHAHPPGKAMRIAAVVFACAGLAPTIEAIASGGGIPMLDATRAAALVRETMDREHLTGPVATLSPQFLPARAIDQRFATGPFYFRSTALLNASQEYRLHLVSQARMHLVGYPPAILTGGEGVWSSGDDRIDAALATYAIRQGYRAIAVPDTRFTLYVASPASSRPPRHNSP